MNNKPRNLHEMKQIRDRRLAQIEDETNAQTEARKAEENYVDDVLDSETAGLDMVGYQRNEKTGTIEPDDSAMAAMIKRMEKRLAEMEEELEKKKGGVRIYDKPSGPGHMRIGE